MSIALQTHVILADLPDGEHFSAIGVTILTEPHTQTMIIPGTVVQALIDKLRQLLVEFPDEFKHQIAFVEARVANPLTKAQYN